MVKNLYYILDGKHPKSCNNAMEWAKWMEQADRHVKLTDLPNDVQISTVFLGLNHSFCSGDIPILFETMIFGGKYDNYQERYATWEEAEKGHSEAVDLATNNN